jgi:Virulence factor BrkB
VGGSLLTQQIANQLGVGAQTWTLLQFLRWPLVFVLLVVAVSVLYRFAPNIAAPWPSILVGATAFAIGWLLATLAFAVYVANFSNYGATYGSLGSVIILMLWFYLTAVLLVSGAELAAVVTRATDPARIQTRQGQIELIQAAREATRRAKGSRDTIGDDRRLTPAPDPATLLPAPATATPAVALPRRASPSRGAGSSPVVVVALASAVVTGVAVLLARVRPR